MQTTDEYRSTSLVIGETLIKYKVHVELLRDEEAFVQTIHKMAHDCAQAGTCPMTVAIVADPTAEALSPVSWKGTRPLPSPAGTTRRYGSTQNFNVTMDDALTRLDGLTAVIQTDNDTVPHFVVSCHCSCKRSVRTKTRTEEKGEEYDEEESILTSNKKRRTVCKEEEEEGNLDPTAIWKVTLGCEQGWWSVAMQGQALETIILRSCGTERLDGACVNSFAHRMQQAFDRKSMMFGVKRRSTSTSNIDERSSWSTIKLYIDLEADPIELRLGRMPSDAALSASTRILLYSPPPLSSGSSISSSNHAVPMPSFELQQLQRKLVATQQALREERHKYRSLLAAPSAANARAGRRPVVGLGPSFPMGSQRSQMQGAPSSSASSGSRSRSGFATNSSSSGAAPSSDDFSAQGDGMMGSQRSTQRMTSLVNPTRVRRADPSENMGFVGDDEDE